MKKRVLYILAVLGVTAACTREETPKTVETNESNAATITVVAGNAGTRTAIVEQTEGFDFRWKKGDRIGIVEGCPAFSYDACETYGSEPLAADTEDAVFKVTLEDRDVSGPLSYTAFYPFDPWGNGWGIPTGYYDDHGKLFIGFELPDVQRPTADSFDPNADLLVSKPVNVSSRLRDSDQLTFQFARVGTIVKMVLNGLPEGLVIREGELMLGFDAAYYMEYLPDDMIIKSNDGTESIFFDYDGINDDQPGLRVGSDRCVTVWLRCKSGETWAIDVGLNRSYFPSEHWNYHRRINFRARGEKLVFKEGGLTTFTVNFAPADVENPDPETVTYQTNAAMDGVTVSWPDSEDEDLAGYEAFLLDENDVRYDLVAALNGTQWEAVIDQGLNPGSYELFVRALASAGKVSQPDYMELDEALHIGVPVNQTITGWCLGENSTTDTNFETTYKRVTYGFRNMFYDSWYSNWSVAPYNQDWAFWTKTPLRLGRVLVKPQGQETADFAAYASDEPFVDGIPHADDVPLEYTLEYGGMLFSTEGKKYFLMAGRDEFFLSYIALEYYH